MLQEQSKNRIKELDFLRGIAILLVLFRHHDLTFITTNMGWIGVDLFFVLSGYLISGLLFKEFIQKGTIDPVRFLIRRGFKIYPIYYIFYIPYILPILANDQLYIPGLIADLIFLQNYVYGWGYAYGASWSLAVEEHFYIGLALLLWFGLKKNFIFLDKNKITGQFSISMEKIIWLILFVCLILRFISNYYFPDQQEKNFSMSHLRIDSLIAGVYISFLYHFHADSLMNFFRKNKSLLLLIAIAGLSWTPFIEPVTSFFAKTIGFTLLYISFSILLVFHILENTILNKLQFVFSKQLVDIICKIGFCSYSIYIIHTFVNNSIDDFLHYYQLNPGKLAVFIVSNLLSILLGMIMTNKIERYFLSIRNKYFPGNA